MKPIHRLALASALALFISACSQPADLPSAELATQYGTAAEDTADAVATGPNGVVYTLGSEVSYVTDSEGYKGRTATFAVLNRFDRSGKRFWTRRVDLNCTYPPNYDMGCSSQTSDLEADAVGNVYAHIRTYQNEGGDSSSSSKLLKYNPSGRLLWQRDLTLKTVSNASRDFAATTGFGINAQGQSFVAFRAFTTPEGSEHTSRLRKYDANGNVMWEIPSSVAFPQDVAVSESGNVYVLGGDALAKYGVGGKQIWTRSLGDTFRFPNEYSGYSEAGLRLAVNGPDSIYLSGNRFTHTQNGTDIEMRALVQKYNALGIKVWERATKPSFRATVSDISADAQGDVYLTGYTQPTISSKRDLLVRKYTSTGQTAWTTQFALPATNESGLGIAAHRGSELYVVGSTDGKVKSKNFGGQDAFLMRFDGQGKRVWSR